MNIRYKVKGFQGKFYAQISIDAATVHCTSSVETPDAAKKAARIWLRSIHDATARYRRQKYEPVD